MSELVWQLDPVVSEKRADVVVSGLLTERTVAELRDFLVKCCTDGPDVLVVRLEKFAAAAERLLTVFAVVSRRLEQWPGTALVLVCRAPALREVFARNAISRFVVVVADPADVDAAIAVPRRLRVWRELPRGHRTARAAQLFVRDTCAAWQVGRGSELAVAVAVELVENALEHTTSVPRIRLELRRGLLTVAVTDDSPARPVLLEAPAAGQGLGLRIIAEFARVWGSTPTPSGGKVVWAVLTTWRQPAQQHDE